MGMCALALDDAVRPLPILARMCGQIETDAALFRKVLMTTTAVKKKAPAPALKVVPPKAAPAKAAPAASAKAAVPAKAPVPAKPAGGM